MSGVHVFGAPPASAVLLSTAEHEQGIVGTLLANNARLDLVGDILRPEHFSDPLCARIYADIVRIVGKGGVADVVTLRASYEAAGLLAEVGGPAYLAGLLGNLWPASELRFLARQVVDRWRRRRADEIADALKRAVIERLEDEAGAEILSDASAALAGVAAVGSGEGEQCARDAVDELLSDMERAVSTPTPSRAVATGLRDLDRLLLGGVHPGQMVVIGARPSIGKSMLAGQIALSAARRGVGSCIVSLEMTRQDWRVRLLANLAGIPGDRLRPEVARSLSEAEWDALRQARGDAALDRIHIVAGQDMTAADVLMRAQAMVRRHKVGLLVVDYLGLLKAPAGMGREGLVAVTEQNSKAMKRAAQALDVPVVVAAQLNRDIENREDPRPTLADLRWSGSIEQDADVVILLHRAERHLEKRRPVRGDRESEEKFADRAARFHDELDRERGRMDLFVEKHRQGRRGHVRVAVEDELSRIGDVLREIVA
ncbi:AAA family ATPase [Roseomonas sp. PWR1]|uniref:DNA 5'-3' helicase n=1 Tax=Roseomonas nitratireducens TaxID=2820810 RepID=A0ABS4AXK2_9PROT|nr:DnaB-like helicase C-terminal domain-containing protein [Neoroseomonas nitratireducens]MBP0465974.1 AAA family ATPase [Neoroseomonas nitratireducens]